MKGECAAGPDKVPGWCQLTGQPLNVTRWQLM